MSRLEDLFGDRGLAIVVLLFAQGLFTGADVLARWSLAGEAFTLETLVGWWLAPFLVMKDLATLLLLYVYVHYKVGAAAAMVGSVSIVLGNALGFLFIGEVLSTSSYVGVVLAVMAVLLVAFRGGAHA